MSRLKRFLIIAISFFIVQTSQAQQHYNAWFRSTLSIPIGEKFEIDNEFQHRRQSGHDNANLFDKNLMYSYRIWGHYKHNEDVKFSVSPFAYFSNYTIIQNYEDEHSPSNSEIRFSVAIELQHEIFKKFYIIDRTAIEQRVFQNHLSDKTRLRNRFGFRYDFTKKINLSIIEELLFNVAGTTHEHFFDHDRIGVNLEYKVFPNFKFDIGYIHITRLPISNSIKLHDNNIVLNLTYQLHNHTETTENASIK